MLLKACFVKNVIELFYVIQILAEKLQHDKIEILNESAIWLFTIQSREKLSCLLYKIASEQHGIS